MLRAVPDVPEPDVLKRVHSVGPQANLHVRLSVPESRLCAVRKRASAARERSWDSERASRGRGRRESERVARKAFSSFARRARFVFVRRVEKKSRLHRVPIDKDDAATPRANPRGPDPGRRAGLRGAFRARNKGDVPGDHSSLAICRLVYSVVPLGTAPARRGGSSVGPDRRAACRNGAARERGGERTARLTRQREYRQRHDHLSVSGARRGLRHDRQSEARARGAPLVLSREFRANNGRRRQKSKKAASTED